MLYTTAGRHICTSRFLYLLYRLLLHLFIVFVSMACMLLCVALCHRPIVCLDLLSCFWSSYVLSICFVVLVAFLLSFSLTFVLWLLPYSSCRSFDFVFQCSYVVECLSFSSSHYVSVYFGMFCINSLSYFVLYQVYHSSVHVFSFYPLLLSPGISFSSCKLNGRWRRAQERQEPDQHRRRSGWVHRQVWDTAHQTHPHPSHPRQRNLGFPFRRFRLLRCRFVAFSPETFIYR